MSYTSNTLPISIKCYYNKSGDTYTLIFTNIVKQFKGKDYSKYISFIVDNNEIVYTDESYTLKVFNYNHCGNFILSSDLPQCIKDFVGTNIDSLLSND